MPWSTKTWSVLFGKDSNPIQTEETNWFCLSCVNKYLICVVRKQLDAMARIPAITWPLSLFGLITQKLGIRPIILEIVQRQVRAWLAVVFHDKKNNHQTSYIVVSVVSNCCICNTTTTNSMLSLCCGFRFRDRRPDMWLYYGLHICMYHSIYVCRVIKKPIIMYWL